MPADNAQSDPSGSSGSASQGTEPLACVSCRARKLKCDRIKPACSRCLKIANDCVYPESRRKPTFKRRNVKELEARLAQVEDYLKEVNKATEDKSPEAAPSSAIDQQGDAHFVDFDFDIVLPSTNDDSRPASNTSQVPSDTPGFQANQGQPNPPFTDNRLVDLGMTEALPPFEVMEELNSIFFQSHYHFIPIVHPGRYLQAFYANPLMKPPMCLQYAIWALAAQGHEKYDAYHPIFYQRARDYANNDEMKGIGEHFITIAHAQSWGLLASYEAKRMLFTRAAMSGAKCIRLCHMMGLDRLDGDPDELPPALGPPVSWAELEERRRVFWGAFTIDCHASISTGWPNLINSDDITTRMPSSEDAFIQGKPEKASFLHEVFQGANYVGFAGTVLICQIFKIILHHVHRSKHDDRPEDVMHGNFWIRHRDLDNKLSSVFMFLPEKFRISQNFRDPVATHTNLNLHAAIICLHHAAIEKADKHNLPDNVKQTSFLRLKAAAEEIVNIIKLTCHSLANFKSPLCALSLYCATTVFVYIAKNNPTTGLPSIDLANLELIIQAMDAIARHHEITRAFMQQACHDVELNGLDKCIRMPALAKYRNVFGPKCSSIPLIARSSVAKHTEVSPVLPGKLPLGNPQGSPRPSHLIIEKGHIAQADPGVVKIMRELLSRECCFQAVLGAVNRNVRPPAEPDSSHHKRKRTSPSPSPKMGEPPMPSAGFSMADVGVGRPWHARSPFFPSFQSAIPDRTVSSSGSSPANQGTGTGTETVSGSSHTSPSIGLGNTAEENRVDLRAFQDRISAPIWQTTEETFLGQFTETIITNPMSDGTDPWGILNTDIDWDAGGTVG